MYKSNVPPFGTATPSGKVNVKYPKPFVSEIAINMLVGASLTVTCASATGAPLTSCPCANDINGMSSRTASKKQVCFITTSASQLS
jgi:hypothetical protein